MSSRQLLLELRELVRGALRDLPFPSPDGDGLQAVQVFLHGLPEDQEEGCYPFVIVRWVDGQVELEPDHKTLLHDSVALALGVYSPESQEQAGLLLAEMHDCLRRAVWTCRLLAGRYQLEELKSAVPPPKQRWHQYHLATIETVWNYTWPPRGLNEIKPF